MNTDILDQGYWHYASPGFPANAAPELGYVHIAFFVRWCAEKHFLSEHICTRAQQALHELLHQEISAAYFLHNVMDETLRATDLTQEGRSFADRYYKQDYLTDYSRIMRNVYLVPDTEENYQKVRAVIENRYAAPVQKNKWYLNPFRSINRPDQ